MSGEAKAPVMPSDRVHACYDVNSMGIAIAWIEFEEKYGFELVSCNMYGDEVSTEIKYCPFCGVLLNTPEIVAKMNPAGKRSQAGIVVVQS